MSQMSWRYIIHVILQCKKSTMFGRKPTLAALQRSPVFPVWTAVNRQWPWLYGVIRTVTHRPNILKSVCEWMSLSWEVSIPPLLTHFLRSTSMQTFLSSSVKATNVQICTEKKTPKLPQMVNLGKWLSFEDVWCMYLRPLATPRLCVHRSLQLEPLLWRFIPKLRIWVRVRFRLFALVSGK